MSVFQELCCRDFLEAKEANSCLLQRTKKEENWEERKTETRLVVNNNEKIRNALRLLYLVSRWR